MARSCAILAGLPAVVALVEPRRLNQCAFDNTPTTPFFWDPTCTEESLGCLADGVNVQCRFCGEGAYREVFCPASWCEFDNPPHTPTYWDSRCAMGLIGCLADGTNVNCRFCGEFPYNGTVHCPDNIHVHAPADSCQFDNEPLQPFFWDVTCEEGMLGCHADGRHEGCRFCGSGDYAEVACPSTLCTFAPESEHLPPTRTHMYYWDPDCWTGPDTSLGCLADGVHPQCRFCGGEEYASVPCPSYAL